ncbi:MAG: phage tail protein [Bacteroidetes bacterium]|nr:MAG: phage tail protein [Bacteroidota bacterium]
MFGGNFAPRGWALCDGQLLAISQNQALFSILGTTYGGDGRTTFGLPDMRGRIPMHPGNGPGLTSRRLGEKTGWESVTLNLSQMPSHTHQGSVSLNVAKGELLEGQRFDPNARSGLYYQPEMRNIRLGQEALAVNLSPAGGNQPFQILQPSNCVNFIICLQGTYPSRS